MNELLKNNSLSLLKNKLNTYELDIWLEAMRTEESHEFTVAVSKLLSPSIDLHLLKQIVTKILESESSVGKTFHSGMEGDPYFRLDPHFTSIEIDHYNFRDFSDLTNFFKDWACKVWSLSTAPLIEIAIGEAADNVTALMIRAHHIIADSWALNVLMQKILDAYNHDSSDLLAPKPVNNVFKTIRSTYDTNDIESILPLIEGTEPCLFTKAEKSNNNVSNYRYSFKIDAQEVSQNLDNEFTPFLTVSTALSILLSHVYSSDTFFIGVPFLNRDQIELNRLSQRANSLPLKVDVKKDDTPRKIGRNIKNIAQILKKHESISLGNLISSLARPAFSRQFFDTTVSYLHYPENKFSSSTSNPPWNIAHAHSRDAIAIHLHTYGNNSDVNCDICLNPTAFNSKTAVNFFAETLIDLIEQIPEKMDVNISEFTLLTTQQNELLNQYENGPKKTYSKNETVVSLFENQVKKHPDNIALRTQDGKSFSYLELSQWSSSIAQALNARGVQSGDIVAVAMERSPEMIASIYGILKAGAAYLPIDSEYPSDRIKYMLEDSDAKIVISNLPHIIAIEDPRLFDPLSVSKVFSLPFYNNAKSDSAAYIIYTSGSTGRPKGVVVEHHAVVNRLEWMQEIHPLQSNDVILQKTPISFDVSVWEIFWWAIAGASVALLKQGGQRDPRELIQAINKHGITVLHFVPSMFEPYVQTLVDAPQQINEVTSLRCIFTSGEALIPSVVNKYKKIFQSKNQAPRLINLYGPTEATVDVTYHEVDVMHADDINVIPIGRPINNTSIRIVSKHGKRLPIGLSGEIQIGGVQLAKEYFNRPELTADKFVLDKHDNNTRWYRTGDLGTWDENGSILYLGRIDGQVKVRGNRIELGEIKSALLEITGILNAEVLVEDDEILGKHLVGVYVTKEDVTDSYIRQQLGKVLPAIMIPNRFERFESIPLTPNGKFDRSKASHVLLNMQEVSSSLDLNEVDSIVVKAWKKVLKQQNINPNDDFYSLGGDSILMLKVRSELEAHGYEVSLTDLAQYTTVRSLGNHLDTLHGVQNFVNEQLLPFALVSDSESGRLTDYSDAYPASQLQLGLIYHSRGDENSRIYKDVFRYTIRMQWDEVAFISALKQLILRHPALRTKFNLSDFEKPLQIIKSDLAVEEVLSIHKLANDKLEETVHAHMEKWTRYNYSFTLGPLFHIGIFIKDNSENIDLVLSFHHAILDGGSVANLIRELLLSYSGISDFGYIEDELPNPSLFVKNEIQAIGNDDDQNYWKGYLAGSANTQPIGLAHYSDKPLKEVFSYRFNIDSQLEKALLDLAKASQLPVKSIYLAAHAITLALMSGDDEVLTGVVTHSRPEIKNSEYILGLFLNTIPLRVQVQDLTWLQLAENIYKNEKKNHRHRLLPLGQILAQTQNIKIQTAFNFIHFHILNDISVNTDTEILDFNPTEVTNFSILVNVMRGYSDEQTKVRIDLDGAIYAKDQGETYAKLFQQALEKITYQPHSKAILSISLDQLGMTIPSISNESFQSIPQLLKEARERFSKGIAVVHNDKGWTYNDLWDRSNQIASQLQKSGIKQHDIVGIALPRSFDQIASIIAIMRMGAVCLPIDVSYPLSRIQLILEIANPATLISDHEATGLPPFERKIVLDQDIEQDEFIDFEVNIEPKDGAYILFTSGSTGKPKGVTMPHRSLSNLVNWQNSISSGSQVSSTLQFAPLSFDVSFQEIFSTLCSGRILHLVDDEERRDPAALLRLIDKKEIERVFLPYVALQQLAETSVTLDLFPRKLRVIASSGEQLRVTQEIRTLLSHLKGGLLENQYGPTETHVVASHEMTGSTLHFPSFPPIGKPISEVGIAILDQNSRVVPIGATGEICIFGDALANGYYHSPDQTREKFIAHPNVSGGVYYRTGDIGTRRLDDNIICLGRNDTQVKVRGYRIEPCEIELRILDFFEGNGNRLEVAVIACPRDDLDSYLVAFLVGSENSELQLQLNKYLTSEIPSYMIPNHFVWIDKLPKTPSGKRDDTALRQIDIKIEPNKEYRAPSDQYERRLCELVAELLKISNIAPEQSIFDCGATSLTAMRIVVLVEKLYGVNIPLSTFVTCPTVSQLATFIRKGDGEFKFDPLVPLRETGDRKPLFLVHPMGGNILAYLRMLSHLPVDQPLYALQSSGVDAGSTPIVSVEEQATYYIEAIKRIQPVGPYLIGGWSYGGFVAFEIANQLIKAGEEVSNILILDTMALSSQSHGKASDDALITWFFWEFLWTARGSELPVDIVPPEIVNLKERFDFITEHAIQIGAIPTGSTKAVIKRLFEVYRTNWEAATNYDAGKPELNITLIRAKEPLPKILREMHDTILSEYNDPLNGWKSKTSGRVKLIEVEGDHLTIMEEPYVNKLVSTILNEINVYEGNNHV